MEIIIVKGIGMRVSDAGWAVKWCNANGNQNHISGLLRNLAYSRVVRRWPHQIDDTGHKQHNNKKSERPRGWVTGYCSICSPLCRWISWSAIVTPRGHWHSAIRSRVRLWNRWKRRRRNGGLEESRSVPPRARSTNNKCLRKHTYKIYEGRRFTRHLLW